MFIQQCKYSMCYIGLCFFFQDMLARKAQRAPSVRLRFGRSDPSLRDNEVRFYKLNKTV